MDQHPRIAFFSEHASPLALLGSEDAGGQNVYVDEVSRNLAQRGYAVDIFTRCDSYDVPEVVNYAPGVRVIHLGAGPAQFLAKDDLWKYMPDFREAFLRFMAYDDVSYDLLHGNFWMSGWVVSELQHSLHIPAVQIFHALGKTKHRHQGTMDSSPPERIATEIATMQQVDRIIAQCPAEWAELVEDYGVNPAKVVVIPSAVNTQTFHPVPRDEARRHIGLETGELLIVYVGRMLPRKDARNIVRALALLMRWQEQGILSGPPLPPLRLLLVGGQTEEPNPIATPEIGILQSLAQELGVADNVTFVGKRQQQELRYFYSAGDVVVTTPWYEPFGLTPLEAMACGRPVIGSAVGGIRFTIKNGETGFLVPPFDPEMLAVRLYQLLSQPALGDRMGKAARLRVERTFTWPVVAMRTDLLYQTLLKTHTHASLSVPARGKQPLSLEKMRMRRTTHTYGLRSIAPLHSPEVTGLPSMEDELWR